MSAPCLQKLNDKLAKLNKQKDELEQKASQLARSLGSAEALAALEAASRQLGEVAGQVEETELEWLELAELAGDL